MNDKRGRSDGTQHGAGEQIRPRHGDEDGNADNVGGESDPGGGGSSGVTRPEDDDRGAGGTSGGMMCDVKPLGIPGDGSPDTRPTDAGEKLPR